eukprot:3046111-Rhodomonas_salina.2
MSLAMTERWRMPGAVSAALRYARQVLHAMSHLPRALRLASVALLWGVCLCVCADFGSECVCAPERSAKTRPRTEGPACSFGRFRGAAGKRVSGRRRRCGSWSRAMT